MDSETNTVLASVISGLIGATGAAAVLLMNARHSIRREDRRDSVDEVFRVVDTQRQEMEAQNDRIDSLEAAVKEEREERWACQRRIARIEAYFRAKGQDLPDWDSFDTPRPRPKPPPKEGPP